VVNRAEAYHEPAARIPGPGPSRQPPQQSSVWVCHLSRSVEWVSGKGTRHDPDPSPFTERIGEGSCAAPSARATVGGDV